MERFKSFIKKDIFLFIGGLIGLLSILSFYLFPSLGAWWEISVDPLGAGPDITHYLSPFGQVNDYTIFNPKSLFLGSMGIISAILVITSSILSLIVLKFKSKIIPITSITLSLIGIFIFLVALNDVDNFFSVVEKASFPIEKIMQEDYNIFYGEARSMGFWKWNLSYGFYMALVSSIFILLGTLSLILESIRISKIKLFLTKELKVAEKVIPVWSIIIIFIILSASISYGIFYLSTSGVKKEVSFYSPPEDDRKMQTIIDVPGNQYFYFSSPAIDDRGNIYIGTSYPAHRKELDELSNNYYLYSFDTSFEIRWRYDIGPELVIGGPVIHPQGFIIFLAASYDNSTGQCPINCSIYVLNQDGTLNWSYPIATDIENSWLWIRKMYPCLDHNGNIYVTGKTSYYSFFPNGTIRWKFKSVNSSLYERTNGYLIGGGEIINYPISPAVFNNTVIFNGIDVKAFTTDGEYLWTFSSSDFSVKHSPSFGKDGTIYYGTGNGTLFAIKPNGSLKWKLNLTEGYLRANPTIDSQGNIYIGTKNNENSELFAIDPNGKIKWRTGPLRDLYSTPTLGNDGIIYQGAEGQIFLRTNMTTGEIISKDALADDVTWSSCAILDEYIFIGDMSGSLYAIYEEGLELANSSWPCLGGNNQRTAFI